MDACLGCCEQLHIGRKDKPLLTESEGFIKERVVTTLNCSSKKAQKRTWTKTSSTFLRYRQTPYSNIRVIAHAVGVSVSLLLLAVFEILAIFKNKNES